MKNIFLITALMIAFATNAQLVEKQAGNWQPIGKLKFGGITKASMEYLNTGSDTTYLLFVKDFREQPKDHYFSIKFKNTGGTYSQLYTILKSFFLPGNKKNKTYVRTFDLGNTVVNVSHKRLITSRGIMFFTKDGYANWSEKDIDKLFGFD
jgi:hypothetical protein